MHSKAKRKVESQKSETFCGKNAENCWIKEIKFSSLGRVKFSTGSSALPTPYPQKKVLEERSFLWINLSRSEAFRGEKNRELLAGHIKVFVLEVWSFPQEASLYKHPTQKESIRGVKLFVEKSSRSFLWKRSESCRSFLWKKTRKQLVAGCGLELKQLLLLLRLSHKLKSTYFGAVTK